MKKGVKSSSSLHLITMGWLWNQEVVIFLIQKYLSHQPARMPDILLLQIHPPGLNFGLSKCLINIHQEYDRLGRGEGIAKEFLKYILVEKKNLENSPAQ